MPNIKNRLAKLEAYHTGELGLNHLSLKELEARIRELWAKKKGCKPEEVDLSHESIGAMMAELKAKLDKKRPGWAVRKRYFGE